MSRKRPTPTHEKNTPPVGYAWLARGAGLALILAAAGLGIWLRSPKLVPSPQGSRVEWIKPARANRDHPRPGFGFDDVTEKLGITYDFKLPEMDPMIRGREGYFFHAPGVAIADFDGDGWMDIFLPNARKGSRNQLYLNQQGRAFQESAEAWGIADTNAEGATASPVVLDFNNDGKPDLYLARMGCSMLFRNTGHGFVDVSKASGIADCDNAITAIPLDFDHDGWIDLYVLRYWRPLDPFHMKDPFLLAENPYDARNGGRNTLYRNRGDGTFEDVTDRVFRDPPTRWSLDAVAADLSGSGGQELYIANDFGPDAFYRNEGGKFVDDSHQMGMPDRRQGMGVSLGDLDGDGTPHVFVTNIKNHLYQLSGNFLWKFGKDGEARDDAVERSVDGCQWAWGSAFGDFGLSGRQDLYVANGFLTSEATNEYAFRMVSLEVGMGTWVSDVRNWPDLSQWTVNGRQVDCFFLNHGDHFDDVSEDVGLTRDWDGRAVGLVDFDNNGSLDLLVTTRNGPVHLLKNRVDPKDHWIGFALQGTASNRDAAGARIEVRQGGHRWYRWATAGRTGFLASSDPRIHFGIPEGGVVDASIRWPSGRTQELKGLRTGKYYPVREDDAPRGGAPR